MTGQDWHPDGPNSGNILRGAADKVKQPHSEKRLRDWELVKDGRDTHRREPPGIHSPASVLCGSNLKGGAIQCPLRTPA
jgi:hypothetical protein